MRADDELHCRIVIIGDSGVGKTSLLNRIIGDDFNPYELNTIGANYQTVIQHIENRNFEVQVWDTAGQEKFKSLSPIYFRNSLGAIAVFSMGSKESFEHLNDWIGMFVDTVGDDAIIAIAGNKSDLAEGKEVEESNIKAFVEKNDYLYQETSALTGEGVQKLFETLSKELFEKLKVKVKKDQELSISGRNSGGCC